MQPSRSRWDVEVVTREPAPRPRPRRAPPVHTLNHDRWLVSYADFITLLFAVFATMYALSVVDAKKFSQMAQSLRQAFKTAQPASAVARSQPLIRATPAPTLGTAPVPADPGSLSEVRVQLQQRLAGAILANQVAIEMDPRGLLISIREAGAFAASRADLSDTAQSILAEVGDALATIANHVRVEGHTDDVPIHTDRFASNWELSTTRATTVVRFFVDWAGVRPERMSAAGYAEYFPRAPNTSEPNRARNRRVDIVILSLATQASEEPAAPAASAAPAGTPPSR